MASIIRIKRSEVAGNPSVLGAGELAYSAADYGVVAGGGRLYIGIGTETGGDASSHIVIGGKYFTDKLDHSPGTLTASSAIIVDGDSKIDVFNVDNLRLDGNTISSTDTDGNISITPDGTGKTIISNLYIGDSSTSLDEYIQDITGGALVAGEGIDLIYDDNAGTTTISGEDASYTNKGIASFSDTDFVVSSGAVSLNAESVQDIVGGMVDGNTETGIDVTYNDSTGKLNFAITTLTELNVDNININGNEISSTNTDGNISLNPNGTGNIAVNNARITGLADPVDPQDSATKAYVDNAITGLTWKDSVHLLANTNIALSGSTNTLVIDSHAALDSGDDGYRILLLGQTTTSQNGIYVYNDNGTSYTLTRSSDADTYQELVGAAVFVKEGTTYGNTGWVQTEHYLTDFSGQAWVQFSGAGAYTAGDGLGQSGTEFFVNVAANGGIEISADALQLKSTVAGDGLTLTNGVLDVVGTTNRISVSANAVDIATTYVGQTSITTLGTIATGTWNATTIGTTKGGTGLTAYATGDLLYASATNTLSKLAAGAEGKVLQINASGVPVWGDVDGGTY